MAAWLVLRPALPYIVAAVGLATIFYLIDDRAYRSGVQHTEQRYEHIISTERERLRNANQAALEAARLVERRLRSQLEERNAELQRIIEESRTDPDADRRAIGSDGVSRIDRVR